MANEDQFATVSSSALKQVAAGAADVIDEALDTVAGPLVGATFSVFEALVERNNEALAAFRLNAVEDEVIKLRAEFGKLKASLAQQGQQPDRQDPLTQAAVASQFVRGVSEAKTTQKREALVHAACAQFDPNRGSPAARDYWLQRVRDLPEIHLAFLLLIAETPRGLFNNRVVSVSMTDASRRIDEKDLLIFPAPEAEVLAYQQAAKELEAARLIWQPQGGDIARMITVNMEGNSTSHVRPFNLLLEGKVLLSYCMES